MRRTVELSADKLFVLTSIALSSGALGTGAPEPDGSRFQEAVRLQVERILNANVILGAEDGTGRDGLDTSEPRRGQDARPCGPDELGDRDPGQEAERSRAVGRVRGALDPADPVGEEIEVNGSDGADGDAGEEGDG